MGPYIPLSLILLMGTLKSGEGGLPRPGGGALGESHHRQGLGTRVQFQDPGSFLWGNGLPPGAEVGAAGGGEGSGNPGVNVPS